MPRYANFALHESAGERPVRLKTLPAGIDSQAIFRQLARYLANSNELVYPPSRMGVLLPVKRATNPVDDYSALPFCGLVTEGLPRLQRLLADEIRDDNDATPGPAEIARVYINGERASIPNVGWIQQQLLRLR